MWAAICDHYGIESTGEDVSSRNYEVIVHEPGSIPDEKTYKGEVTRLGSLANPRP